MRLWRPNPSTIVLVTSIALGCEADCDVPLSDCDRGDCAVVTGFKLREDGCFAPIREPAACGFPNDDYPSVLTTMRGPGGTCWRLDGTVPPYGFEIGCPAAEFSEDCRQ